jgi:SAM-dependent methyltransferase
VYSTAWFDTFARTVSPAHTEAEVAAIARRAPPEEHPRLLDIGCGTGRVAGPLSERGYRVTGIDVSVAALGTARRAAPDAVFVALDQRHVGRQPWRFDVAVVLWNSIGFGTRADDVVTLRGVGGALRPGGKLLLDLYHPDWLLANEHAQAVDDRGAAVRRSVRDGRCFHRIRYPGGAIDDIQFNVYRPAEIVRVLQNCGFRVQELLVWWQPSSAVPDGSQARYQLDCVRR